MIGSRSKLLQIQGKWYWERKQKKTKPEAKEIQKLFYTPVEICGLENEQCLTALVVQPKVTTTSAAMAL